MLGGQCGLTPDQVLDMNLSMLQAYIEGYQERMFDLQCLAVHQGFWAGYYQSKKPKPVHVILQKLFKEHSKRGKKHTQGNAEKPEVNLDQFMEREARRQAYLAKKRK